MREPLPINTALPRNPDGSPEFPEEVWDAFVRDHATEMLGAAEGCDEPACRRARKCMGKGAPCIERLRPDIDPVVHVARLLINARGAFVDLMRERRAEREQEARRERSDRQGPKKPRARADAGRKAGSP